MNGKKMLMAGTCALALMAAVSGQALANPAALAGKHAARRVATEAAARTAKGAGSAAAQQAAAAAARKAAREAAAQKAGSQAAAGRLRAIEQLNYNSELQRLLQDPNVRRQLIQRGEERARADFFRAMSEMGLHF